MTKKEISKLASKISKLKSTVKLTGDNEKDWGLIRIAIVDAGLYDEIKKTNPEELRDKGFLAFALSYNYLISNPLS